MTSIRVLQETGNQKYYVSISLGKTEQYIENRI